jgi:addiction module HigA family antidote
VSTQRPPHPGSILKERFLDPLGISSYRLARSIGVPTRRVRTITYENGAPALVGDEP